MAETLGAKPINPGYNPAWDTLKDEKKNPGKIETADDFAAKIAAFNKARGVITPVPEVKPAEKPAEKPVEAAKPAEKPAERPVKAPQPAETLKPQLDQAKAVKPAPEAKNEAKNEPEKGKIRVHVPELEPRHQETNNNEEANAKEVYNPETAGILTQEEINMLLNPTPEDEPKAPEAKQVPATPEVIEKTTPDIPVPELADINTPDIPVPEVVSTGKPSSSDEMHEIFASAEASRQTIDVDPSEIRPLKDPSQDQDDDFISGLEDAIIKQTALDIDNKKIEQIVRGNEGLSAEESDEQRQAKEQATAQAKETELQLAMEAERQQAIDNLRRQQLEEIKKQKAIYEANHPDWVEQRKKDQTPIIALNMDWTHDKREIAHDLAEQTLNKELESGKGLKGLLDRIWRGTVSKEYQIEKIKNEYMEGKRKDEQGRTVTDIIKQQKQDVIERFTMGAIEDGFVHKEAGEKLERLEDIDKKTAEGIKSAIADYARYELKPGEKQSDLDRELADNIARVMQEAIDDGRMENKANYTNYLDAARQVAERYQTLAINARGKAEQDAAMAQVMAGFEIYNAEVRNGVRTEAHRNNIDKIVDKLGKSRLGNIVSSELLYGAVGTAAALTQTGARAALSLVGGGILASSAISGLKERNRITEDRVRMLRDAANGLEYGSADKNISKYETRIGGTLYDMQRAGDLTANLEAAMNPEGGEVDNNALLQAIAEARVRIDYSDAEKKDLIAYSSADKRGRERLDLDIALIRAEKSLSREDRRILENTKKEIMEDILEGYYDASGEFHAGVREKDENFARDRIAAVAKKAGKTAAIGALTFVASQEVMALLDPGKIGILEKAGILKGVGGNRVDAKETSIASLIGNRGTYEVNYMPEQDIHSNITDPDELARYEAMGYKKIESTPAFTSHNSSLEDVDPSDAIHRATVKYDGWAHNGTKFADGNEIRGHLANGQFVSNMRGSSTFNGGTIDYGSSNIKGYLTIGGAKFEIAGATNSAGQLTWGENGVFTTTTGETIKAIGDNGEKLYKYFEIVADNGVEQASDGTAIQHIIPLATDVGSDTFSGKITQLVENIPVENPAVYTVYKSIPRSETFVRGVVNNGIAITPPDLLRPNLGAARAAENAPEAPEVAPRAPESAPAAPETPPQTAPEAPESASSPAEPVNTANANTAPRVAEFQPPAPSEPAPAAPNRPISDESDNWNESITAELLNNRTLITSRDGIDGYPILINPEDGTEESQALWARWWSNLSEEGKNFVRDLENRVSTSPYKKDIKWGDGFRFWLSMNDATKAPTAATSEITPESTSVGTPENTPEATPNAA